MIGVERRQEVGESEDEDENGLEEASSNSKFIHLMTVISAIGGFLYGYDTGIISGALVFVKRPFQLNTIWQEFTVSVTISSAWISSMIAGTLSERYGRRKVIIWASVIFALGSVVMGFAWNKYMLLVGRGIVGMAIGLSSSVIPLYIAEVAPIKKRGSLVSMNTCFINLGILSAAITAGVFSYDHLNGWRWMLGLAALPAAIQFIGFLFLPESPRWLIAQKRREDALAALVAIRNCSDRSQVMREFQVLLKKQMGTLVEGEKREEQGNGILVEIWRRHKTRRALLVGCLLQAFQQLAGINTVMYYTATIIEMSGVKSQSLAVWLSVPTTTVYFIATFCGYLVADRLGRRTVILSSLGGVILSLLLLGSGFYLNSLSELSQRQHSGLSLETWLVLAGLIIYLTSFAPGMSGMPWTVNSELYPMWARSFCYSISTSIHWLFNMIITSTFISLTELLTTHGAFFMYALISSIGWFLIFYLLPETRGRSLDDVDSLFSNGSELTERTVITNNNVKTKEESNKNLSRPPLTSVDLVATGNMKHSIA